MNSIVRRNVPGLLSDEVRKATVNDPVLMEVMDIVQNISEESRYKSENLGSYNLVRSELSVAHGSRIVVRITAQSCKLQP